jgi:hypothetical protein
VPLISCARFLSVWLAYCFPLLLVGWDLLLSLAQTRLIVAAPWLAASYPSFHSRLLSSLSLLLSVLPCLGSFLFSWALGFPKAVFLPTLPLLLLFFLALPG